MPYITFEGRQLTIEQKTRLINEITKLASEITQISPEFFLMTINELPDENIGIGGKTLDQVKVDYLNK